MAPAVAGCSTGRTDQLEPGDVQQQHRGQKALPVAIQSTGNSEVVGQLKRLRDTLRGEISELAKTTALWNHQFPE